MSPKLGSNLKMEGIQSHIGGIPSPQTQGDLIMQITRSFRSNGSNTLSSLLLWFSVLLISLGMLPQLIPYYLHLKINEKQKIV
tara:strand:+ start:534 stop:782 length:249 start_codon:yes stop_codon:yes gene_type:complete